MKILFMPMIGQATEQGSLSRCLAIAEEAVAAGHEAGFVCHQGSSGLVGRAGFRCFDAYPLPPPRGLPKHIRSAADAAHWMGATDPGHIDKAISAETRAVGLFQPDLLFSESLLTAPISAALTGVPLASTASWTSHPGFVSPLFDAAAPPSGSCDGFNQVLLRHGLPPIHDVRELFFLRSKLKIAPTLPEFEPELQNVPNLNYVGYLLSIGMESANVPGWLETWDSSRPTIFVYLGSPLGIGKIWPEQYLRIIPEAFDGTEFRVVLSISLHPAVRELPPPTPNVRFEQFVPGLAMMHKSDLVIFYGGQNTAMSVLLCGVPSIVIPGQHFERDFNADCLVNAGTAIKLPMSQFHPRPLLTTARRVMVGSYKRRAVEVSQKLRALGGPSRALEILLSSSPD